MRKSRPASMFFHISFRVQEDMRADVEFLLRATRSSSIAELFRFLIRQEMKTARPQK
jgi:hypothetical protein